MKKIFYLLVVCMIFVSCMTSNFTLTGNTHKPLLVDSSVKIVLTKSKGDINYEEIGVLQIIQEEMDDLSKALELAKKEARLRGGDIVFLISNDTKTSVGGNQYGVFSSEKNTFIFIIGKIKK